MENNYEELRQEFNKSSFRKNMISSLSNTCYNCGSQENIEYHHIVPLKVGGTNRLTNIVPLCHRCHEASHIGRHRSDLRSKTNRGGRPKKWVLTMKNEMLLWMFARGEIGMSRFREKSGLIDSRIKLQDTPMYQEFLDKHNIDRIRNIFDIVQRNAKHGSTHITSLIYYKDGKTTQHEHTFVHEANTECFDEIQPQIVDTGHGYRYVFN